jgi:glutamate-1-semialdehyde 2,1-aminomutase
VIGSRENGCRRAGRLDNLECVCDYISVWRRDYGEYHREAYRPVRSTLSTSTEPLTTPTAEVRENARSQELLQRGMKVTPGGVNTARRKIEPSLCVRRGQGAYVEDVDGNRYIDYHAAYGAILLGHSHPEVNERVIETIGDQVLFGVGTTEVEVALAEKVVQHVPCAEQAVLCGSGSEATFHAIRLARAVTGRSKILKFQGAYHGFHDYVLMNVMSAPDRVGRRDPMSAGMLDAAVDATIVCRYNDAESVREAFEREGDQIAAVIVEPIAHNMPSILPVEGFLASLRECCDRNGSILIFDEVITGFRHGLGGYQAICGVTPDLGTFGKGVANGYPIAIIAGKQELMERYNTTATGNVTFAGTYNGGAPAAAAALATIEVLEREPVHERIFALGDRMRAGLAEISQDLGVQTIVSGFGSLYVMLFMEGPLRSYEDVLRNDRELFVAYRKELVRRGVLEMPENIGRNHITYSHTEQDIDRTLEISKAALQKTLETFAKG